MSNQPRIPFKTLPDDYQLADGKLCLSESQVPQCAIIAQNVAVGNGLQEF